MPIDGPLELVVLLIMALTFAGFIALGVWLLRRLTGASQSRLQSLEARVRELERREPQPSGAGSLEQLSE